MPQVNTTSVSLIDGVKHCDSAAWARLVQVYGPLVYQWGLGQQLQSSDAADLVQDVFVSVLRGIHGFENQKSTDGFRKWLRTIFRNRLIDFHRRNQGRGTPLGGSAIGWAAEEPEVVDDESNPTTEHAELMWRAIRCVKEDFQPSTWQAFWRTVVDGARPTDVATELGLTPSAVCMCRTRVLRRLRETLGND